MRWTEDEKDAHYIRWAGPLAFTQRTGIVAADITDSLSESTTDPSITLRWTPNDELMFYGSYAEGHKSGGFQGAIPNATAAAFEYLPESAEAFEVGMKGGWSRASFEVAAFHMSYEDLQVSAAINANPNTTVFAFFTGNAAEATSQGVELSGTFIATDYVTFTGSMAFLDAQYDSYPDGPCALGQAPDNPSKGSCNLTGVVLPFAPDYSGSLAVNVERPITNKLTFIGDVTVSYRDDFRTDATNDAEFIQEFYDKWEQIFGEFEGESLRKIEELNREHEQQMEMLNLKLRKKSAPKS